MKLIQKIKNFLFKKIAQKKYNKNLSNEKINKILIIRDGGIGDAICSYPLIRELKINFPNAQIDIYASLNNHFMYKYNPYINNVYLKYKKRQWYKSYFEIIKMRNNHYYLAIDDTVLRFHRTIYTMLINPDFILASSGTKTRYGFDRNELSFYYKTYSSYTLNHIVDKRLKILDLLKINNYSNKMDFYLPNNLDNNVLEFINKFKPHKVVALNTEGSNSSRTLTKEQIIKLCTLLKKENLKIIPFCLPSKYNYFENLIKENNLYNVELPYKTKTIFDAAFILKHCDLLISPDTSFIHIASGLNIPTIGLFWNDPSKYIEWGPKSDLFYSIVPDNQEQNIKNINLEKVKEKTLEILF
ncbi:glycosyltransferase family 9 protein [Aliarcobacter butzleri]|uniref:glycosyltransferase family 9 protein n=1 Tax=Aliarcobacter butzleri TaxID=28197 RepID=UPI003AFAEDF4